MAFVKLDCGLLNSTLWLHREQREMFITALLMAEPYELREPTEQIEVRSLDYTGFVVQPGWYGFIPAAGIGIIGRAKVDKEAGLSALEALGAPDPESRSPEHDGRRMIRIDGGYLILNYQKYREKDHTSAERSRRYRERKLASHRDNNASRVTSRSVTQAEAEAEAEVLKPKTSTSFSDEKATTVSEKEERNHVPFEEIQAMYHAKLPELPRCVKLTNQRKGYIRQRWLEDLPDLDSWEKYFDIVRQSKFLLGKVGGSNGRPPFRADLAWLCKPENIVKIIEGKYHRA